MKYEEATQESSKEPTGETSKDTSESTGTITKLDSMIDEFNKSNPNRSMKLKKIGR